jgi:hypothetical protein
MRVEHLGSLYTQVGRVTFIFKEEAFKMLRATTKTIAVKQGNFEAIEMTRGWECSPVAQCLPGM